MPYKMAPGGAYRMPNIDEVGEPQIVEVDRYVAKRARYTGHMKYFGDDQVTCAMFKDDKTGEVYGQPVGPVPPAHRG